MATEQEGPPVLPAGAAASLDAAAEALWAGGIVGIPTETVYGIAVVPRPETLRQVLIAKRRPAEKGIALIVDSIGQVEALAVIPAIARRLAARFWPGPLTLVLEPLPASSLPEPLYGPTGGIGFRLPDHDVPRALAVRLGPLAVTSANLSGEPDPRTADDLLATIGGSLALVLDDGPVRGGVPSTVVIIDRDQRISIPRVGALSEDQVRAAAEQ